VAPPHDQPITFRSPPVLQSTRSRTAFGNTPLLLVCCLYALFIAVSVPLQQQMLVISLPPEWDLSLASGLSLVLLWTLSFAVIGLAAALSPSWETPSGRILEWLERRATPVILLATAMAVVAPLIVARWVLDTFPNSADEHAYIFQARHLAAGKLWEEVPPLGDVFVAYRTWVFGDKLVSQYPPGWPLVLALAVVVGLPLWATNALVGGASAAALASTARRCSSRAAACLVALIYVATPFYVFNAASFHSHVLSALCILVTCMGCMRYSESGSLPFLVLAGIGMGILGLSRYMSLALLLPALAWWALLAERRRLKTIVATLALTGLPFLAFLLLYQDAVTGSPLKSTYEVITEPEIQVSFDPWQMLRGARFTIQRVVELGVWTSPVLLALYGAALIVKIGQRSQRFYDLVFPSFVLGYILFVTLGGNRYGPRYYFDAFPLVLATIASAGPQLVDWGRRLWGRPVALHAVLICLLYALTAYPAMIPAYHEQVTSRQDVYRLAQAMKLENAIVILKSRPGFGMRADDLARNGTTLDGPVLYARAHATPEQLRAAFPGRSIWVYTRGDPHQPGRLTPVD
jgi:hypothetical protein